MAVLLVPLLEPLVSGYDVDIFNLTPVSLCSSFQNCEMNNLSLSEIISSENYIHIANWSVQINAGVRTVHVTNPSNSFSFSYSFLLRTLQSAWTFTCCFLISFISLLTFTVHITKRLDNYSLLPHSSYKSYYSALVTFLYKPVGRLYSLVHS